MATLNNQFIHFDTFANFNSKKLSSNESNTMYTVGATTDISISGTPDIKFESIVFIKDTSQFWTHGKLYNDLSNFSTLSNTIKSLSVSGRTITYTRGDGTTGTIVTQDTNTTYNTATTSANGLMSSADKKKLDGIATGATAYSHPTSSGNKHIPSGGSSGQILRWSADGTAVWGNDNNTTYSTVSKTAAGLCPALPNETATTKYLRQDGSWVTPPNTTYSAATTSTAGLLSATDKKKLDGIATGATANVGTITGIKMNGASKGTSGVVDLGTVITSHQSLANYAPKASPALTGTPTAPTANSGTNSTQIATTAFVQTEINNKIAAADAMIYKGTIGTNGTITSLPNTTAKVGWVYKVITAGTYDSKVCEVGDMIVCLTPGSSSTNATWTVIQTNIDGAVTGPASSVANRVAVFNGTSGKVIKDSGYTIATSVPANAKFTDTTYSAATTSTAGLLSATDKKKLDGIATGANAYSHPTSSGNKHIPSGGSSGQILRWSADGTAVWGNDNNTWRGIQNNLTSDSTTDSLSAAQGKALKSLVDGKAASNHNHNGSYVYDKANSSGNMNDAAGYRNAMGMINLTGTDKTVNPNGQTGWHHFINMSYIEQSGSNMWQTQIANAAGSTDLWVRSRSGGAVTAGTSWEAPWTKILTESNIAKSNVTNALGYTPPAIWTGTQAQYNALTTKSNTTLYLISD